MCLVLFTTVAILAIADPSRDTTALQRIEPNLRPVVCKLPAFLSSPGTPDIVLMGSSLWLTPARLCDEYFMGCKPPADLSLGFSYRTGYLRAKYFQSLLSRRLHPEPSVVNLAIAGAAMSDQLFLLERMLADNKRPRLIILAVAPRDFLDNTSLDYTKTLPYRVLVNHKWAAEFSKSNDSRPLSPLIACWQSLEGIPIFAQQCRIGIASLAEKLTGHPLALQTGGLAPANASNLLSATMPAGWTNERLGRGFRNLQEHQQLISDDLIRYRGRYVPFNKPQVDFQMSCYKDFLSRAEAAGLNVLVVNMPLTLENKQLLPNTYYKQFVDSVQSIAGANHIAFVNADFSDLTELDFTDSCHLNAFGGKRLFEYLCKSVDSFYCQTVTHARNSSAAAVSVNHPRPPDKY